MNNLEWLYEHERDKLVKLLTGEYISCDMCYYRHDYPDCGGDCERNVREWLDDVHSEQIPDKGEHVDAHPEPAPLLRDYDEFLSESDSREKLEADVLVNFGDGLVRSIIMRLLERQAEITERETEKKWSCFSDSADGHITELTNQLESAHAKNRALKAHIAKMQEGRHGWHIKGKELQQQVDTMRDVIREFRDERDSYRELCGKLLDAADEMRRVRDQFDAFTEVD